MLIQTTLKGLPHATQLTDDIDAGHVGLEIALNVRNVDAALSCAKHQRDGIDRTTGRALAVANAARGVQQGGTICDQAEYIAFGAGIDAGTAAQANGRIDYGMQRRWFVEACGLGAFEALAVVVFHSAQAAYIG